MAETRSAKDTSVFGNGSARRTRNMRRLRKAFTLLQYLLEVFFFVLVDLPGPYEPAREADWTCPAVARFCALGLLGKG